MPNLTDIYNALRQASAAGDTASAQRLSDYIRELTPTQSGPDLTRLSTTDLQAIQRGDMTAVSTAGLHVLAGSQPGRSFDSDGQGHVYPTGSPAAQALQDPTSGMTGVQKFEAGAGKAPVDLARGLGQMVGLESRKDVADSRAQDAPLMSTGSGKWGNIAGNVGTMAPAMLIPGANTLVGAAAIGAGSGLAAPSTSTGETLGNTALGGVFGPAGLLVGRGAVALAKGAKAALIDPFSKSGQQAIAARAMQSFAGSPQEAAAAANALSNPPGLLSGVQPTTAELANNAGLAQLERSLRNNPEYMQQFNARDQGNKSAITTALEGIAQTPADRAAAVAARSKATAPLYEQAGAQDVPVDDELKGLLNRPSMQSALTRAQKLAAEKGAGPITLPENDPNLVGPVQQTTIPGKGVQYLKMGLSDIADTGEQKGMGAHETGAVNQTLGGLKDWIGKNAPALKAADATYEGMSRPINRMDIGQDILDKTTPALGDFGNTTRINANSFANSVSRQGDALASRVSGNPNATLATTLEPHELQALQQVGEQFARRADANDLGRAVGSNTGQNLVGQHLLSQLIDPLGASNSILARASRGLLSTRLGGLSNNAVYGAAERDVTRRIAQAYLDPKIAAGLLRTPLASGSSAVPRIPYAGPATVGAVRGLLDSAQQ